METHRVIDGNNSEQQQSQTDLTVRPTLSQVKKSWGFRRSTIARREFMEEVGDLTHSPPIVRRGRSRRTNQTTEAVTTPTTRSVIEDLEWSTPSSPVSVDSKTSLEASAAGSLDPSLWQDFGSAFHTAFSLLGGNEDLSMDIPDALVASNVLDATNAVEALTSQAFGETVVSDVLESAEDMELSLPVAPSSVEGGEIEDIVIISSQEEDSDEMTLIQMKQQLASASGRGETSARGGKGTRGRAKGKGRGKGRGRGKSRGRGRGRGRAVELVSSFADVQGNNNDVMLVNPSEQQQEHLQEEEKNNNPLTASIEKSPAHNNSSTQHSSTDCIMVDTELDQITDVIPGQCNDVSEGEEEQKEEGKEIEKDVKTVREYLSISDTEGYDSNALYCICRQKHNKRFMICCDTCREWFHGECIGINETQGLDMEEKKQAFTCPTCNTKKEPQSESHLQPEHGLGFLNYLTQGEEGEGHKDQHAIKETLHKKGNQQNASVTVLNPEHQDNLESNDSVALCIGPGCLKQALPDSGYCGTDCILQHAAVTMKALSGTKVPKTRGRAQKAPNTTCNARGQKSTRMSKRLAGKAKEEGEKEAAEEEGCTDAESSLACNPSLTEVQALCIPSSQFCTVSEKNFIEVKAESKAATSLPPSSEDTATDDAPSSQIVSETDPLQRNSEEKAKDLDNKEKLKEQSAELDASTPPVRTTSPVKHSSSNLTSQPHETGAPVVPKTTYVIPKKQAGAQPPSSSHVSATASGQKTSSTPALLNETRILPVSPAPSAPSSRPSQPNNQVRQSIQRSLTSILLKRLSDCEDLEMSENEVTKLVASFEMEMFDIFRNTDSKYMNKYRTIMFNLKDPKNKGLLYRVVSGEISPFRLVRMSQKDMQATKAPEPKTKETEAKDASAKVSTTLLKPEAVKVDLPNLPCSARPDRRPDKRPDSRSYSTVTSQEQKKSLPAPKTRTNQPNQGRAAPDILTCMLKDTTSEHKAHLFDVKCKICTGQMLANDEDEPAKKKSRISETTNKQIESSWRRSAGGDSPLHAPPDSPDMDLPASSLMDPTSRLIIDSSALTIAESPASPTTDSPASPVLDSPASPVMDYTASPNQDTCSSTKPKRTYAPVVIPAVSTVTITRRDPRTAASRFPPMSVSSTAHNKTATPAPDKQTSSVLSITQTSLLPSTKILPKSILMKPSSSADSRLFATSMRTMISESPRDGDTAQFLAKQEIMWKGFLNMLTVAKFVTKAYLVSGCAENLKADLPDTIQIGGRILPQTVWDYVVKLKTSISKELCVIRFHPATEEEEVAYVSLFSYFSSRGRFGVVANNSNTIKDVYLVPLSAKETIPSILQPLVGPGLEKNRPNLLLGLAIVQKAKRTGMLFQEIEEKRPSVHMPKDPMWIPKPPVLYGSDKLEIFQPYDPETPSSTLHSSLLSCPVSPPDSSSSGSVTMPSLLISIKAAPPVSNSAVVAATQSTSSTTSSTDPLTKTKTPLQTILSLFGNKESNSTDSSDGSSTTTTSDKVIPVPQVSQSLVDPIVQQYGQRQKSKVKEIEHEENDLDRPYDPEEEYNPGKGYGKVISQIEKHKIDNSALSGSVDDDVAYDPEDETIFEDIRSNTKSHIQTLDSPSSPTPFSTTHTVAPSATSTPAQTSTPVTPIPNLPTGTVVVSAATLTEQQRMLEELNKQIEEQKRQLKEQEEALRQQREAVGMFMAHFSVSDSLMSPPQKSLPVSQLSSQTTDKTINATDTADKSNVNSQTLKQDNTAASPKSKDDTVTVQDETQELAKESDKYSSAGEIEDSDVAYDPEDESLFNEIQEDVFHGSNMKTCNLSFTRTGHSVNRKGASPNSHHSRKRRLSPKRRHRERDRHRSPSRKSQRRSPTHSQRRRERERHKRSERDKSRHRSRDQSGRQTRHRKEHSARHHSRGHRRSSSSPRKKHSVSLSPEEHRAASPHDFEESKHTNTLYDATASNIGSNTSSGTSVTIKNDGHLLKCEGFDSLDKADSPCSSERLDNVKLESSEPPNKESDHKGSFTFFNQETLLKEKLDTPIPLRVTDPPIRESPESPDPDPQFVEPSDIEKTDSIKNEENPQIPDSVQMPLLKVENNCVSIGGQAALSNLVWSTIASPRPGIRDQSLKEVDILTEGVNSGLKNIQMIGQEGHHSQSYTGSDRQALQPKIDPVLKFSGPGMEELGHRESLTGIGPVIKSEGMQGLSPTIWGSGTDIQKPGIGMECSESNTREPGFQYLKTDRFLAQYSTVQNLESASMQTMDLEANGSHIGQSKQDIRVQNSLMAVTNSQITSLDSKSSVMAVVEDQCFVGPQNNRDGCLHTQVKSPFTRGGGVRVPGSSFGGSDKDFQPHGRSDFYRVGGTNNELSKQDMTETSSTDCAQDVVTDMKWTHIQGPGLDRRNEQMGQDYSGPKQNIKNVGWKCPEADMGGQKNQNESVDPHINDMHWNGPESVIRDDWRGSSSVQGGPFNQNEWMAHQHDRKDPNMENIGPKRRPVSAEFVAPEFGNKETERKSLTMEILGSEMKGHGNQGRRHYTRGLGPDFRGPCPERGGPGMTNPGSDRRGPEGPRVLGPGPESRIPAAEGSRADTRAIATSDDWGQGLEPGSRGFKGPAFSGQGPKGIGPSMGDIGPDSGRLNVPVLTGTGPDRRGPAMGDWRKSGTPNFRDSRDERTGPFMDNEETEMEVLGPVFQEIGHESKGPTANRQEPHSRGPGVTNVMGGGCEWRGPLLERPGHSRIGPGDQTSGVHGSNRRAPYIEGPGHERSGQQTKGSGHQSKAHRGLCSRGPGPECGNQNIEGRNPVVRGFDIMGPWLEEPGMEGLGLNKTGQRGLYFRGPVNERVLPDMDEIKKDSCFPGGAQCGGSEQERRLLEEGQQPDRVISCFRPVQSESIIRGQGDGPNCLDFRSPDTLVPEPDRHQPKGSDFRELRSERRGLYKEEFGSDWRRSNFLDFRDPGIRPNIEGSPHNRRDEWGDSEFAVLKPRQGTPDIKVPGLERIGRPIRGPKLLMRRSVRGRGKDIPSLNQRDRWICTDSVNQWLDKGGPNMETVNELEGSADTFKRHGSMGSDEYDQDLSRQGPHGDWRGPGEPGPVEEGSNMRFPGRDDWSRTACQDPPPLHDNPDMVYPGPSRGGPGNNWKEPDRGISGPDRRGPGTSFRGTRDPDNGGQCYDRVSLGPRKLDMGNDFRGHIKEPNLKRPLNHRGVSESINPGPHARGFEVECVHKPFLRGSDLRHPGPENRNSNAKVPQSVGRFSDRGGMAFERSSVGMESHGPNRQEFEHDFRGERRGLDLRPGSWNTTMEGAGLDSRGLEQPMKIDMQPPDIRGPGHVIREPCMRYREPGQRGQTHSDERCHPAMRHFDKPGLHNPNNPHQSARPQSPSEQHCAQFNRPPAPKSGGKPFLSFESPQNESGAKPQRHRAALLPTPAEGLIHFPNSLNNNPDVFRQKPEQIGHSTERKWNRARPAIRKRNMFKGTAGTGKRSYW
ncbi:uncharacterized protein LOC114858249 [Betta splendens]|uniref:Uncharacterized protein LOC114858249 n=1 Tax=Betta splendens TaxID=158456 RepID=A0A6P7MXJ4_BETSP|nr:uncharacterized protein LOC114858249 [Betta splendens]